MYMEQVVVARQKATIRSTTTYAKSKVNTEDKLDQIVANSKLEVISLRFATACGTSSRLRLDLVLNDFVTSGLLTKKINVLSDGTPWRPLIDVENMCDAIAWSLKTNIQPGNVERINIGSNDWNFQVKDLAYLVKDVLGKVDVCINSNAPHDSRSYRVCFDKYERLSKGFANFKNISDSIEELAKQINDFESKNISYLRSNFVRLEYINNLIAQNKINRELYWN